MSPEYTQSILPKTTWNAVELLLFHDSQCRQIQNTTVSYNGACTNLPEHVSEAVQVHSWTRQLHHLEKLISWGAGFVSLKAWIYPNFQLLRCVRLLIWHIDAKKYRHLLLVDVWMYLHSPNWLWMMHGSPSLFFTKKCCTPRCMVATTKFLGKNTNEDTWNVRLIYYNISLGTTRHPGFQSAPGLWTHY